MYTFTLDTNVIINHLKTGKSNPKVFKNRKHLIVPYAAAGELLQGARNKIELKNLEKYLALHHINYGSTKISKLALEITKQHFLKNHTGFIEALIATTAIETNTTLVTLNTKHFSPIKNLKLLNPLEA